MMCASLIGILLTIEHLKYNKISLEAVTGARAEEGISVRVERSPASAPAEKSKTSESDSSKPIDKIGEDL